MVSVYGNLLFQNCGPNYSFLTFLQVTSPNLSQFLLIFTFVANIVLIPIQLDRHFSTQTNTGQVESPDLYYSCKKGQPLLQNLYPERKLGLLKEQIEWNLHK